MPRQAEEVLEYDDFLGWTVSSLKDFLSLRGLKQTGRKSELIARAFGAYELNVPVKFSQEQIYQQIKDEYSRRLTKNEIKSDPNMLPSDAWIDDVKEWPEVDDGKLFSYILRTKAVDVDYIGKYKDQKAYSYWMSGFVDTVFFAKCPINSKHVFLKGSVSPSQKIRDDPHKVWVCLEGTKSECKILTSWCTCTAGTGEVCNHVIALLYKVNFAHKKAYISPACTSVPQGWNKGTRKDVAPTQIKNLVFRKDKKTREDSPKEQAANLTLKNNFDPRKPQDRQLTNERVSALINGVIENVPSACLLHSIEHTKDDGLPEPLPQRALSFMSSQEMKGKPSEHTAPLFLKECQMTSDQVKRVETETRGQSNNDSWHQQRVGRVTASNFHKFHTKAQTIINRKSDNDKKPIYSSMVSSLLNKSDDVSHMPQIKWGNANEKDAIKSFMSDVASQHDGGLQGFRQCGLFIKPDYPFLAGSPDGLFFCHCCGLATLEAKCPYSVRNENIHEKKTFDRVEFLEDFNGKPRLKRSHKYYTQMQAQMWVCGANHGFFIVWTLGGQPLYERVELDLEFCLKVVNNITLFYKSFVLPCLLGYRDIFECPKCDKVILESDEISDSANENSVCCDRCSTWWHLPCAELSVNSADALDSWICQSCLADAANIHDAGDDELDLHLPEEEEQTDNSNTVNHVCPVCCLKSIPVNGEHVCTVCKKAVHAWCSNHEDITSSADLICNYCISD